MGLIHASIGGELENTSNRYQETYNGTS